MTDDWQVVTDALQHVRYREGDGYTPRAVETALARLREREATLQAGWSGSAELKLAAEARVAELERVIDNMGFPGPMLKEARDRVARLEEALREILDFKIMELREPEDIFVFAEIAKRGLGEQ